MLNDQMQLQHYGLCNAEGIQIQLRLRLRGGMGATMAADSDDDYKEVRHGSALDIIAEEDECEDTDFYSNDSDDEVPMHHEPRV